MSQPQTLLDLLAGKEMTQAVQSSPFYQAVMSQPKTKELVNAIRFLETSLETDWRTGLARLVGGGITLAACPQDTLVAVVDARDEQILQKLHEVLLNIVHAQAQQQNRPDKVDSREYAGVTAWTLDGKEGHALVGKRLLFASRAKGLKTVLDLACHVPAGTSAERAKGVAADGSLGASPAFLAAQKTVSPQAAASLFVNLKPLLAVTGLGKALEKQRTNPLAALAFAGVVESLRDSNWLSLDLRVEDGLPSKTGQDARGTTLVLRALTDGRVAGAADPAAFAVPPAGEGAWPNLAVPRRLAALSLYRDLHAFYAAKDTLFPERTSGLIFFENMMGIFFTGRDLTTEVLAEIEPQVRIVVAQPPAESAGGVSAAPIPAFAAVLRLRHPERFGKVVEEAWQKAIGLVNFTRGQKAQPGLIIDRPVYRDTKYTVAYFSAADANDGTGADPSLTVRPTLAMPGSYLILSSAEGLARDLIDALDREASAKVAPVAGTHSLLEIDGGQVAAVLSANRESLIRGDMVKKGKSRPESEAGIDMFIALVGLLDRAKLRLGADPGLTQATLAVTLNLPK